MIVSSPSTYVFFQFLLSLDISPSIATIRQLFESRFHLGFGFRMHGEAAFAFHYIKGVTEILHSLNIRDYCLFLIDFKYRVPSINRVMDSLTLLAALLDLQNIIESSAYRTKGSPLRSSSLSSSLSMILLNKGLNGPPWGVPSSLVSNRPLFITPLRRYLCIRLTTLPSLIVRLRISMSLL